MNIILIYVIGFFVFFCLTIVLFVNSLMNTGHGRLNYKVAIGLKILTLIGKDKDEISIAQGRENLIKTVKNFSGDPVPIASIINQTIQGPASKIPIRIYIPCKEKKLPIIIFYHGGGWVQGDLDTHDNLVRYLAVSSKAIAVSVDYRLAPEHPFPAGVEDAYSALTWIAKNAESFGGDPANIAVMGDSAGGNLAAVISLLARDKNGPGISHQVLVYPATNLKTLETDSYRYFEKGFMLTKGDMQWFKGHYLPGNTDGKNPMISPLLAKNHRNLPPATIITAEMDPLKEDGKLYADKLEKSGVPVRYLCFKGMIHGFVSADRILSQAHEALDEIGLDLQKSFGTSLSKIS